MNPSGKYLATGAAESTLCSVLCAKTFGPVQHFKVSHSLLRWCDWRSGASGLDLWTRLGHRCTLSYWYLPLWLLHRLTLERFSWPHRSSLEGRCWERSGRPWVSVLQICPQGNTLSPFSTEYWVQEKVRDVKYSSEPNRIISFSTDGDVRFWDPLELRGIGNVSPLQVSAVWFLGSAITSSRSQPRACLPRCPRLSSRSRDSRLRNLDGHQD